MSPHPTLQDFALDGVKALQFVIQGSSYGTIEQAVASLALFSNPETVRQTGNQPLFRIVRGPIPNRGDIAQGTDGRPILLDDNTGPTNAFLWANRVKPSKHRDVQFSHIWQRATDPSAYTNLANICLLPAFLAKLSDTHPEVSALLRRRARDLFGWLPADEPIPNVSDVHHALDWAEPLPPIEDVAGRVRKEMLSKPKSRTTKSARQIGWLFSGWSPDATLPTGS